MTCEVDLLAGADGRATDWTITDCPEPFADAVAAVLPRWRWTPLVLAGEPSPVRVAAEVTLVE